MTLRRRIPSTIVSGTDRERLLEIIKTKALQFGEFTLSSGGTSNYYIDLRRITFDGTAAPILGRLIRELTADLSLDAVGGPALAAVPVADAVLHAAAAEGQVLDAFAVRSAPKEHGTGRRIEGPDLAGRRVLVVEDTSTTGRSVLDAASAVVEAGAEVACVVAVADRGTGAGDAIRDAGYHYRFLFGPDELGLT